MSTFVVRGGDVSEQVIKEYFKDQKVTMNYTLGRWVVNLPTPMTAEKQKNLRNQLITKSRERSLSSGKPRSTTTKADKNESQPTKTEPLDFEAKKEWLGL